MHRTQLHITNKRKNQPIMKKIISATLLLASTLSMSAQGNYVSQVWNPDNGNGTYTNPIIDADYSDPDVIAVGDDYYMTASSFQCIPGLPILHSKDLVNWAIINYAIKGGLEPAAEFSKPSHGNGVWAPSIRYHKGEYYIYWGDPDYGVFMVKAKDPAGQWTKPHCVIPGKGMIDTTPLWDDDGRCYLVNGWANSRSRFASVICIRELNAEGTAAIGEPVIVFDGNGTEFHTCEGPKIYKREGYYWLMFPAGGVPTGFQVAARSKNIYGPYESKIVLAQGKSSVNGPHQGGWVHTTQGEDWFIHFQDKECYGRVLHLQPVTWKDNWPVMGKVPSKGYCGEPVITYQKPKTAGKVENMNPVESDEFNSPKLGLQWQWHANFDQKFGMPGLNGTYRIFNYKAGSEDNLTPVNDRESVDQRIWNVPNLLLQKTPTDNFTATTKFRFTAKADNQYGGLLMMGLDYSGLVVRRVGHEFLLQQVTCLKADKGGKETFTTLATLKPTAEDKVNYHPGIHEDIYMRMTVREGKCRFSYSTDGKKFKDVGQEFTIMQGKWIGAKIGFVSVCPPTKEDRGWIDADWFRVTK